MYGIKHLVYNKAGMVHDLIEQWPHSFLPNCFLLHLNSFTMNSLLSWAFIIKEVATMRVFSLMQTLHNFSFSSTLLTLVYSSIVNMMIVNMMIVNINSYLHVSDWLFSFTVAKQPVILHYQTKDFSTSVKENNLTINL